MGDNDGKKEVDPFEKLVSACIRTFGITFSDTTSLDANGVIGKQRYLVMSSDRYTRETKKLRANKTIRDLREIHDLAAELDEEDEEEEKGSSAPEVTPDADEGPVDEYRDPYRDPEPKPPKDIDKKKDDDAKPKRPKRFDKSKIEMRLKLFQQKRDILSEEKGEEEREGDALNIFFIPVTREEFEQLKTTEVSEGTSTAKEAFNDEGAENKTEELIGKVGGAVNRILGAVREDGGTAYHYEEVDGERIMVED